MSTDATAQIKELESQIQQLRVSGNKPGMVKGLVFIATRR